MDEKLDEQLIAELGNILKESHLIEGRRRHTPITGGIPAASMGRAGEVYSHAVTALMAEGQTDRAMLGQAIKMQAAKVRQGDTQYLAETLVGQTLWLQNVAGRLVEQCDEASNPNTKEKYLRLALRSQEASIKAQTLLARLAGY